MTLTEQLILHEGLRLKPYTDTVGKLTIGVGRNLTDRGITHDEAMYLLQHDIDVVLHELQLLSWFRRLSDLRKCVIIDMAFNLGVPRLKRFTRMIGYIEAELYSRAADEMLNSKWAKQVGARAVRLARWMRTNEKEQ